MKLIKTLFLLITFLFLFHNTSMANISKGIATLGQMLGLPEWGISERLAKTARQTVPSYTGGGVLGSGGYVRSPVAGGTSIYPISGGQYTSGQYKGTSAVGTNPSGYNITAPVIPSSSGQVQGVQAPVSGGDGGGGGGGGLGNPPRITAKPGDWDFDANAFGGFNFQEGMYNDQLNAEIESMYNAGMGAWNTAQTTAEAGKTAMERQAEADYAANVGQLGTTKTGALGGLETQKRKGQTQKEDAMAAARRLFAELQMGRRQRFGGATSAGQAASEIQGAEFQRQQGQTARQTNEFFQQIEGQKQNVESQYQAGLLQLQQAKQQSLTNAQLEFSNIISQIASGRAQTEQQKSQMRLNALLDLRNKAFAIQQQDMTFKQQLALMKEQSLQNMQSYSQTAGGAVQSGTTAYGNLTNQLSQQPQFSTMGQTQTPQQTAYQGQTTPTKQKNWWEQASTA